MQSPDQNDTTTIRIVFDGAPFAGKTTAAYSLGEALGGSTTTPSEEQGRTMWFDWMTYTGGRHGGKAIRVELVTVPGQASLSDRRQHLLAWGDVVVFIADTSAAAFDTTVEKFQELQSELEKQATSADPVIVANKRDVDDAVPIELVRERLGLEDSTNMVEAVATDGGGLRQAFIFAVRSALAASANRPDSTTADELLAEMQQRLGVGSGVEDVAVPTLVEPSVADSGADVDDVAAPSTSDTVALAADAAEAAALAGASELSDESVVGAVDDPVEHAVDDLVEHAVDDLDDPVVGAVDESVVGAVDESVADAPATSLYPAGAFLVDAKLAPDGSAADWSIVLLPLHWKLVVAIGNGRTTLPLNDGSEQSEVAEQLLEWGLLEGHVQLPGGEPMDITTDMLEDSTTSLADEVDAPSTTHGVAPLNDGEDVVVPLSDPFAAVVDADVRDGVEQSTVDGAADQDDEAPVEVALSSDPFAVDADADVSDGVEQSTVDDAADQSHEAPVEVALSSDPFAVDADADVSDGVEQLAVDGAADQSHGAPVEVEEPDDGADVSDTGRSFDRYRALRQLSRSLRGG